MEQNKLNKKVKVLLNILGDEPNWQTEEEAYCEFDKLFLDLEIKNSRYLIVENFKNFPSHARTLSAKDVGYNEDGKFTLYAYVHEDYYKWVNFFIAVFDDGRNYVVGDFEKTVVASNMKHYNIFMNNVDFKDWDYGDI